VRQPTQADKDKIWNNLPVFILLRKHISESKGSMVKFHKEWRDFPLVPEWDIDTILQNQHSKQWGGKER
jgi:hypothetical protein